ncbi:hypothetical protein SAMN05660462_03050 [Proteiniborus ethanoligenes]|uniref:Uncharacterized protein n=1 Tax=Proteiniborus ethanoligenes TaxID=415015 RepID=A0A1H3SQZ2_9FIRM|nr:hypothetical protein [Proteiniborus ethanoligenes]SDZ40426.1 hypothetical protein SAMN05660462_03050 [Proteiniborus ethanoligenes]
MPKARKYDYEKIVNIYNESGNQAALEYIAQNYGSKAPRGVILRIKNSPGFSFDSINDKIIASSASEGEIFMGIEELCNKKAANEITTHKTVSVNGTSNIALELLYKDLMQEKLMELSKYIKLNRYSNTVIIDKTALKMDGYQVTIN